MLHTDFMLTLDRMYASSTLLNDNQNYYNSCYLAGYVVECYLKQIIYLYAAKDDGSNYSITDIKVYQHRLDKLVTDLSDTINIASGIPAACRIDIKALCRTICTGTGGYPQWNPKYRYGEHPAWDDKNYAGDYQKEIAQLYQDISSLRLRGLL